MEIKEKVEIPKNPHLLSQWVRDNVYNYNPLKKNIRPKGRMFGKRSKDFPV